MLEMAQQSPELFIRMWSLCKCACVFVFVCVSQEMCEAFKEGGHNV